MYTLTKEEQSTIEETVQEGLVFIETWQRKVFIPWLESPNEDYHSLLDWLGDTELNLNRMMFGKLYDPTDSLFFNDDSEPCGMIAHALESQLADLRVVFAKRLAVILDKQLDFILQGESREKVLHNILKLCIAHPEPVYYPGLRRLYDRNLPVGSYQGKSLRVTLLEAIVCNQINQDFVSLWKVMIHDNESYLQRLALRGVLWLPRTFQSSDEFIEVAAQVIKQWLAQNSVQSRCNRLHDEVRDTHIDEKSFFTRLINEIERDNTGWPDGSITTLQYFIGLSESEQNCYM